MCVLILTVYASALSLAQARLPTVEVERAVRGDMASHSYCSIAASREFPPKRSTEAQFAYRSSKLPGVGIIAPWAGGLEIPRSRRELGSRVIRCPPTCRARRMRTDRGRPGS